MRSIKSDVITTLSLIKKTLLLNNDNIFKAYFNTNEDLDTVFSICDMREKNVLCVQASSDQLFKCMEKDASIITTFDINYITKYFYYLKKNYLLCFNKMLTIDVSYDELIHVIDNFDISNPDEASAKLYWKELLSLISMDEFFSLFYIWPEYNNFDIEKIKFVLKDFKLDFNLINIFENGLCSDKKYDVVVLSNIMENFNISSKTHELLNRIVNPRGEVICSNLGTYHVDEHSIYERAYMGEYFDYDKGVSILEKDMPYQVAYKYIKN